MYGDTVKAISEIFPTTDGAIIIKVVNTNETDELFKDEDIKTPP